MSEQNTLFSQLSNKAKTTITLPFDSSEPGWWPRITNAAIVALEGRGHSHLAEEVRAGLRKQPSHTGIIKLSEYVRLIPNKKSEKVAKAVLQTAIRMSGFNAQRNHHVISEESTTLLLDNSLSENTTISAAPKYQPLINQDLICLVDRDETIRILSSETLEEIWHIQFPTGVLCAPCIVENNLFILYKTMDEGKAELCRYRLDNGNLMTGGYILEFQGGTNFHLLSEDEYVYLVGPSVIVKFDQYACPLQHINLGFSITTPPVILDSYMYFLSNREMLDKFCFEQKKCVESVPCEGDHVFATDDKIYVSSPDDKLKSFYADTLKPVFNIEAPRSWAFKANDLGLRALDIHYGASDNIITFCPGAGTLQAYCPGTGEAVWRISKEGFGTTRNIMVNDITLIHAANGSIYALSEHGDIIDSKYVSTNPPACHPIYYEGDIFTFDDKGIIVAFRADWPTAVSIPTDNKGITPKQEEAIKKAKAWKAARTGTA